MRFILLAESSGLIVPIGEFVIRAACVQNEKWQEAGYPPMSIAVNVSSRQFDQKNPAHVVKSALEESGLPPGCLELEITESTIMKNADEATATLWKLKEMGVQIAIDDFGTGYSSLSYPKKLSLDFLKIDQSFVKNPSAGASDRAIVKATISLAHSLDLRVIAEGVETEEQFTFLLSTLATRSRGICSVSPPAEEVPNILVKGKL